MGPAGPLCGTYRALQSGFLGAVETAVFLDTVADDGGEKVSARYVHVGEVRAVGLVEVIVCFEERGVACCNDGLEQRVGRDRGRLKVDLVEKCAEDAYL